MSYTLAGRLQLPGNATPAAGVDIVFRAATTLSPLIQTAQTRIRTSADGSYNITLPSGTYTVEVTFADNVPFNAGTIVIHSQLAAGLDLPTLLGGGYEPTTPEWIQQIQTWMASAATSATTATEKAAAASASQVAAKTSETNAKASETAAEASSAAASASQTAAHTSEVNAKASEQAAKNSQDSATASALLATTQATQSKNSATASASSAAGAVTAAGDAGASAALAELWAQNPEDVAVPAHAAQYSALHWAMKAMQYAQAASSSLVWKGGWSATAGTAPPAPAPNSGVPFYRITGAGTIASIEYAVGDYIHWDTSVSAWFKIDGTDAVVTVNGKSGAVVLSATDVGALSVAGGTLTGPLIVANSKSAIKVDGPRSISYQDAGNTVYHTLVFGNAFAIAKGVAGDSNIWTIDPNGLTEQTGSMYSRTGAIVQSPNSTKRIGMEALDVSSPYISSRGDGEGSTVVAMRFGVDITVEKRFVLNKGATATNAVARSWTSYGTGNYGAGEFTAPVGTLRAAMSYPFKLAGGYALDAFIGTYAQTTSYQALKHVLAFTDGGGYSPAWMFGADGTLTYYGNAGGGTVASIVSTSPMIAPSFTPTSDIRIKWDLREHANCLELIKPFIPFNYCKKGLDGREDGLVAQSVMETMPDSVHRANILFEGEEEQREVLTVNYNAVTSVNSGAINELHQMVLHMQAEIKELKSQLAAK